MSLLGWSVLSGTPLVSEHGIMKRVSKNILASINMSCFLEGTANLKPPVIVVPSYAKTDT